MADSATSAFDSRGSSVTACCTRSQQRTEISVRRSTSSPMRCTSYSDITSLRVLQQVEDVVHGVDQLVDLLAVDRRDEGAVQQPADLGGDLVGRALGGVDLGGVLLAQRAVAVVLHHLPGRQRAPSGDVVAVLVEQLEEVAFLGQQPSENHRVTSGGVRAGAADPWRSRVVIDPSSGSSSRRDRAPHCRCRPTGHRSAARLSFRPRRRLPRRAPATLAAPAAATLGRTRPPRQRDRRLVAHRRPTRPVPLRTPARGAAGRRRRALRLAQRLHQGLALLVVAQVVVLPPVGQVDVDLADIGAQAQEVVAGAKARLAASDAAELAVRRSKRGCICQISRMSAASLPRPEMSPMRASNTASMACCSAGNGGSPPSRSASSAPARRATACRPA
jgi:hypothetical protein